MGHWATECPIKDIPSFVPEFWNDLDNFAELESKEMQIDESQQVVQKPEPIQEQAPQPVPQAPKTGKRKLSKRRKEKKISEMDLLTFTNFYDLCVQFNKLFSMHYLFVFSVCLN